MDRRELLRQIGGSVALVGVLPTNLWSLGRDTHRRLHLDATALGFFDAHQLHTVAAAGERIVPATDTPGALAARCQLFTERIVADHYAPDRQRRFIDGLVDLDRRASAMHSRLFIQGGDAQQDAVLSAVESDAYAARPDGADSFWRDLKYLTLYGYYTSEIGIEEELKVALPGRYEGAAVIPERAP
jgi:hypothetical protein